MIELRNRALQQLRSGQLAIGVGLRQARTVDTATAMLTAGFDWLFIDMEHNSMDIDTAVQLVSRHKVRVFLQLSGFLATSTTMPRAHSTGERKG